MECRRVRSDEMEDATAEENIDSLEALRHQLETSLMSAFDFSFETSQTTTQPELSTAGPDDIDGTRDDDDDGGSKWSFEILDMMASPAPRSRQPDLGRSSTMPDAADCESSTDKPAPVNTDDLINNNDTVEESVLIDECSYCYSDGDYYEGDIRQLEASPIVLRPKNTDSNVIRSGTISTAPSTTVGGVTVDVAVRNTEPVGGMTLTLDESPNSDCDDVLSRDVVDGEGPGEGLRLVNLKGSPAVMRAKRNPHVKPSGEQSSSKSSSAKSYTKASNQDEGGVNRVQELARRIDNQSSSSSTDITSRRGKQDDLPVNEQRMGSAFRRSMRRKDEQRTVYTESEDFRLTDDERRWIISSASSNYQAMSRLLVDNPALACRRDPITGQTALHWAAKNGRADVVKLVLGSVASPPVECRTREAGHTPLHLAAMHGRHDVIELLVVLYGANRNATDFAGRLPIKYLEQLKRTQAAKGIDPTTTLWLRSEALLKPSDKFIVSHDMIEYKESSTPQVSRRSSIWSSITGSSVPPSTGVGGAADRRPSTSILTYGMSSIVEQSGAFAMMLPPRPLPAVNQRLSVQATVKQKSRDEPTASAKVSGESVSHIEDKDGSRPTRAQRVRAGQPQTVSRNTGSTSDSGTLV